MSPIIDLKLENYKNLYKELVEIRILMDENLSKAKQLLTNMIKRLESVLFS